MDIRFMGLDNPLHHTLHHILDLPEDSSCKTFNASTRTYVCDAKAMAATSTRTYIFAVCQDRVLTVTMEKLSPPHPKKPKTIEIEIA